MRGYAAREGGRSGAAVTPSKPDALFERADVFEDPTSPPDAPARESIEHRAFAFW